MCVKKTLLYCRRRTRLNRMEQWEQENLYGSQTGFEELEAETRAHTKGTISAVFSFLCFFHFLLSFVNTSCLPWKASMCCALETGQLVLVTLQGVALGSHKIRVSLTGACDLQGFHSRRSVPPLSTLLWTGLKPWTPRHSFLCEEVCHELGKSRLSSLCSTWHGATKAGKQWLSSQASLLIQALVLGLAWAKQ